MYWGADNADADSIIISTVPSYLSPFPPGCAFEVRASYTPALCIAMCAAGAEIYLLQACVLCQLDAWTS